jgi:hypothetical protein
MDMAITTRRLPLQTVEHVIINGNLEPQHHIHTVDYYFSLTYKKTTLEQSNEPASKQ